jgi:flagellar basal body-associated protein FliL
MKNKKTLNGGYVGLVILLVGVSILVFFMFKSNLTSQGKYNKNAIEKGNDYINQAKNTKDMLEKSSQRAVGE